MRSKGTYIATHQVSPSSTRSKSVSAQAATTAAQRAERWEPRAASNQSVSVQTRAPVRIKRREHRARCSYAQQRNGHCHPPSFSIVHPQQKRKRASRHHGGAARGKMGTTCRFEPRKKLSRFPTQFRGDQTRQRVKGGSAAPNAAVGKYGNRRPAVTKTAGAVEVFGA